MQKRQKMYVHFENSCKKRAKNAKKGKNAFSTSKFIQKKQKRKHIYLDLFRFRAKKRKMQKKAKKKNAKKNFQI